MQAAGCSLHFHVLYGPPQTQSDAGLRRGQPCLLPAQCTASQLAEHMPVWAAQCHLHCVRHQMFKGGVASPASLPARLAHSNAWLASQAVAVSKSQSRELFLKPSTAACAASQRAGLSGNATHGARSSAQMDPQQTRQASSSCALPAVCLPTAHSLGSAILALVSVPCAEALRRLQSLCTAL